MSTHSTASVIHTTTQHWKQARMLHTLYTSTHSHLPYGIPSMIKKAVACASRSRPSLPPRAQRPPHARVPHAKCFITRMLASVFLATAATTEPRYKSFEGSASSIEPITSTSAGACSP